MNKKILIIPSALVIILAITSSTLAFLITKSNAKNNEFVPGVLTAVIRENGFVPDSTNTLTPTETTVDKKVQVQNVSDPHEIDAYIRVMLVPAFRTEEGTLAGNMSLDPSGGNAINITAPGGGTVTLNLISKWGDNWIYDNGYFYYKAIVHPNEVTEILLDTVTVSNTALWRTFHLEVLSDSIQAESGAAAVWGTIAGQLDKY